MPTSVIVGGSSGLGRFIAERFAQRGDDVIITSRNPARAQEVAAEIGGTNRGLAVPLAQPTTIAAALADIDEVDNLVLTAFAPTPVTLHGFNITDAIAAITVKLVGCTELVRCLHSRLGEDAAWSSSGVWPRTAPIPARRWSRPTTPASRGW